MADTTDYYFIRTIKQAVYRITEIGDQVEIRMINEPRKAISYKLVGTAALTEIQKVKATIEAEAEKIGLGAIEDKA